MKKNFFLSICIGSIVGAFFAWGFLYITPKLSDIFADMFFYPSYTQSITIKNFPSISQVEIGQYSIKSVEQIIPTSTKIVYADLGNMKVTTYTGGEIVKQYSIQSIGREGTAWQTPLGKFNMNYKKENHFSSIGHVWMPYSIHFFGNYFIHGWPYYPGGTPVAEGYSGGCIRLNTPDAQELYEFVDKETQLIVTNSVKQALASDQLIYKSQKNIPDIESKFLIADIETGEVLASQYPTSQIPISSFAKIMTGLISLETLNQYQDAILYQNIVQISDVLHALLLTDSEEAGEVLYEQKNKNQYIKDMNIRAASLDMVSTVYADVNGVSSSTRSTLEDTFRLLQYVYLHKPFIIKVLSQDSYTKNSLNIQNIHPLISEKDFFGGFVNAEKTQMITFFKPSTGLFQGKVFVIIVDDSLDVVSDTNVLYSWMHDAVLVK